MNKVNKKNSFKGIDLSLVLSCLNEIFNGYKVEKFEDKFGVVKSDARDWYELNHEKILKVREEEDPDLLDYFDYEEVVFFYKAITEVFIGVGISKGGFYHRVDFTIPEAKQVLEKFNFPIPESIVDDTCWNKPLYVSGINTKDRLIKAGKYDLLEKMYGKDWDKE